MINAIKLLETLGSNASMANLSSEQYADLVRSLPLDTPTHAALADKDQVELGHSLGGNTAMKGFVVLPESSDMPVSAEAWTALERCDVSALTKGLRCRESMKCFIAVPEDGGVSAH